jgi:hypothetical protein
VQWLDYDRIANVGKAVSLFPAWSSAIGKLMHLETQAFIEHVIFDEEGTLTALLTAPYSYTNAALAAFYGFPEVSGEGFEQVRLDPDQRAGLLTQGSLLTINAHSDQTSPVHRGKLVRERILCDLLTPPPDDIMITVPDVDPSSTARERFAVHSENPYCAGCHVLMDGLGFAFENYDAIGVFRTMEAGQLIDATGELVESDIDGAFDGAVDLAHKLTQSGDVQRCYARQWFRYAYGRGELEDVEDACTLAALDEHLAATGGDIKELLVSLTQTDAFLYRPADGASP